MKFKRIFMLFSLWSWSVTLIAQVSIKDRLNTILNDSLLIHSFVGVSVRDVATNKLVYERNGTLSFTPASNLKLITTAAALDLLGADYRFITRVYYSDTISNHSLKGDLVINGGGDPTLGSDKMNGSLSYQLLMRNIVSELKLKGITQIEGRIVIDPTHFEYNPIPMDYTWADIGNYYGAGSFGLNLNENQTVITLKPSSKVGGITSLQSILPWDSSWSFINHIKTGVSNSGDKSIIYSSPYNPLFFGEGTIPMGTAYAVKASISDPSTLFANLLIAEMNKQGVVFKGTIKIVQSDDIKMNTSKMNIVYEHKSPTIKEICTYANLVSNNLYAECLLKEISFKMNGVGSAQNGINHIKKYLSSKNVDTIGMVLRDGSGMSPFNSISPNQFTQFLVSKSLNTIYVTSIPIAGLQGTVAHICKGSEGKIRVKSGTMNGTTCYSGYVQTNSGNRYAVSFMVNKHEAKNRMVQHVLSTALMEIMRSN